MIAQGSQAHLQGEQASAYEGEGMWGETIGLKEERSRLQARVYQVQLEKKDLAIEHDIAQEELATT
jgi:hypothetical protein